MTLTQVWELPPFCHCELGDVDPIKQYLNYSQHCCRIEVADGSKANVMDANRKLYFVYIMTNHSGTLYVGVTNDIQRRVFEHKQRLTSGFTARYRINRLVYFEETQDIRSALEREKQIKGWTRKKKITLIETVNPGWIDLSDGW